MKEWQKRMGRENEWKKRKKQREGEGEVKVKKSVERE